MLKKVIFKGVNTQHAPCAIQALKAGVNVMVEKPFTVTLDEAIAIAKAEKESGKMVNVGFQPRMSTNYQTIKQVIDSGELGKIYYIQTGGGRRRGIPTPFGTSFIPKDTAGIGAIGDIGCYALDLVLNAIGYPKPLTATGYTTCKIGEGPGNYPGHPEYADAFEVDDFAAGFVRLEGDIILDFRIAWAMNIDTPCDTIILGDKGGLRIPSTGCWNGICDPIELMESLGDRLVLAHIKDGTKDYKGAPLGMGEAPVKEVYEYLKNKNIPIIVECEAKDAPGLEEAEISMNYLKSLEEE